MLRHPDMSWSHLFKVVRSSYGEKKRTKEIVIILRAFLISFLRRSAPPVGAPWCL